MGLQGMINDMVAQCDFDLSKRGVPDLKAVAAGDRRALPASSPPWKTAPSRTS
jgi:hypothetical protein